MEEEMLKVHMKANDLIDVLAPVIGDVQRADRPLADQIRRAAQSVVLNIAEGENVTRGNQRVHFERAAGSNGELRAGLRIAARWSYIAAPGAARCDAIADEVAAMLWRLMHR